MNTMYFADTDEPEVIEDKPVTDIDGDEPDPIEPDDDDETDLEDDDDLDTDD